MRLHGNTLFYSTNATRNRGRKAGAEPDEDTNDGIDETSQDPTDIKQPQPIKTKTDDKDATPNPRAKLTDLDEGNLKCFMGFVDKRCI